MKHLAIRSLSIRKEGMPYTTPGLGDMTHTVLIGYLYGLHNQTPVTLHLTEDKYNRDKPETYQSLISLLPAGSVTIKAHAVSGLSEPEWMQYLRDQGYDAEAYCYMDIRHRYDTQERIDIAPYFATYPALKPPPVGADLCLPDKFVTSQWDSTAKKRRMDSQQVIRIQDHYRSQGYQIVPVGGEATEPLLRRSLPHIGYAMSQAGIHIGVDSGFMHFAQLYLQPANIHIYATNEHKWSHHLARAIRNGCQLNHCLGKIKS